MYKIYSHTTPDGKIYIGQAKNVETRWNNGKGYEQNSDFHRAIGRYGWENIRHDIICECETKEEADFQEAVLIVALDAENPERGYNRTRIKADAIKSYIKRKKYVSGGYRGDFEDRENIFKNSGLPRSYCAVLIDEWIFNERDREIMKRRLLDGVPHKELAKEFDLSIQRIKIIVGSNISMLKKHL